MINSKNFFLFLFLYCTASIYTSGIAQPYFSDSYDLLPGEEIIGDQFVRSAATTDAGTYFYQNKRTNYRGNHLTGEIAISFLENNSNLAWQKIYKANGRTISTTVITDAITNTSNGVAFIGNILDSISMCAVFYIDSMGNEVNRYIYEDSSRLIVRAIDYGENNYIYLAGTEFLKPGLDFKNWSIFLSIIDSAGKEIVHRNYNPRYFSNFGSWNMEIECLENGNIVIASSRSIEKYTYRPWVLYLDSAGEVNWIRSINPPIEEIITDVISVDYDEKNHRIYLGLYAKRDSNKLFKRARVIALDMEGRIEWELRLDPVTGGSEIYDLTVCRNGDILVCGYVGYYGFLARIDKEGELLWKRLVFDSSNLADAYRGVSFTTVNELKNGDILLGGNIINTVGGGDLNVNAWFVRLDSTGNCYGSNCPEIYDSYPMVAVEVVKVENLKIFPNPATAYIQVQFSIPVSGEISLINMKGRKVKTVPLRNREKETLYVNGYPPGIYTVVVKREGKVYASRNIVIQ